MDVANDNWIWCDIQFSNYHFAVRNKTDGIDAFFMHIRSLFSDSEKINALTPTSEYKPNFQIDWSAALNQLN